MISVGIDIGRDSVKIAELTSSSRGFEVTRLQHFPLSSDPNKDKEIEIIDVLRSVSSQYDPNQIKCCLAVPQEKVSTRRHELPFRERYKINKVLAAEMDEEIPYSQDDAIFDAKITQFAGAVTRLVVTATPKENVHRVVQVGGDGSLDVDIVSVEGLALANLFEDWSRPPGEALSQRGLDSVPETGRAEAILNIGHGRTLLLVIKAGALIDVRSISWGGKDLAEAVAHHYKIQYLEAQKELKSKSFVLTRNEGATKDQIEFSDTLKASIDRMAQQVHFTLLDLKNELNIEFESVGLLGGVSLVKNLGPYLTQKLEIATNRVKQLGLYPQIHFASNNFESGVFCATAIGLAMEGLKKPFNPPTNLLKGDLAKQSQTFRMLTEKWGFSAQLLAAIFVLLIGFGYVRGRLAEKMDLESYEVMQKRAEDIAGLKGSKRSLRNINAFVRDRREAEKAILASKEINYLNSALDIFKDISSAIPTKDANQSPVQFFIKSLDVLGSQVTLSGVVKDPRHVAEIKKALTSIAQGPLEEKSSGAAQAGGASLSLSFSVLRKVGR